MHKHDKAVMDPRSVRVTMLDAAAPRNQEIVRIIWYDQ
jgi:hypothetical protein